MRIVAKSQLREYWTRYSDAELAANNAETG